MSRVLVIGGWGAGCCEGSLGLFCSIMCTRFAWHLVLGFRRMSSVPWSSISRTDTLLDFPHGCGWFAGAVVGLLFCVYWFDSHSSAIPFSKSPHVTLLEALNWSMLMPVTRYVALASSCFPVSMCSINASKRVCIHPHSISVSSLFFLRGCLLLNFVLNLCNLALIISYFFMTWIRESDFAAILSKVVGR